MHYTSIRYSVWRAVRTSEKYIQHRLLLNNLCASSGSHERAHFNHSNFSSCASLRCSARVRFAPSPTGFLHLGGLRTALYNYLLARSTGGSFIMRLEDTDQTRLVPGADQALYDMLEWAGLPPDEGPVHGGSHGPYIQSQRVLLYEQYAQQLLDSGAAYRCFCSPFRLELIRNACLQRKEKPKYDNRCRSLSEARITELTEQGTPSCIRLKLEPPEPFTDLVFGKLSPSTTSELQGDPVILKTDGQGTYHLANVVDDHLMHITHVMRGSEWLTSTHLHLQLYRQLGWSPPSFLHLPLMLNMDGGKLSKRQDNLRVESLRSAGYTPRTLLNLVLGGGLVDRDHGAIYSLEELVEKFSVSRLITAPSKLDMDRLEHFSRLDLHRSVCDVTEQPGTAARLVHLVQLQHAAQGGSRPPPSPQLVTRVLKWSLTRPVDRLQQLLEPSRSYLWGAETPLLENTVHPGDSAVSVVRSAVQQLETVSEDQFTKPQLKVVLSSVQKQFGLKMAPFMKIMRQALCGTTVGDPVAEILETFGREESLDRLGRCLELWQSKQREATDGATNNSTDMHSTTESETPDDSSRVSTAR